MVISYHLTANYSIKEAIPEMIGYGQTLSRKNFSGAVDVVVGTNTSITQNKNASSSNKNSNEGTGDHNGINRNLRVVVPRKRKRKLIRRRGTT